MTVLVIVDSLVCKGNYATSNSMKLVH